MNDIPREDLPRFFLEKAKAAIKDFMKITLSDYAYLPVAPYVELTNRIRDAGNYLEDLDEFFSIFEKGRKNVNRGN